MTGEGRPPRATGRGIGAVAGQPAAPPGQPQGLPLQDSSEWDGGMDVFTGAGACGIVDGGEVVGQRVNAGKAWGGAARVKRRLARVRRAVARFAVRYGTIGVSLLVAVVAVGIAGLTLTVAPENVKETWTQRLAIVIGGWSVAGGGIWLGGLSVA